MYTLCLGKVDTSLLLMKYAIRNNADNKHSNVIDDSFASVSSVEKWISSLADTVGVDEWKADMKFTQCGGDSFQLVQIINLIDNNLGAKVKICMLSAVTSFIVDIGHTVYTHPTFHETLKICSLACVRPRNLKFVEKTFPSLLEIISA